MFQDHCCILYSIIGWNCVIGAWSRIEGTKFEPNPNEPHARLASESLFQKNGRLIASTTVLGKHRSFDTVKFIYLSKLGMHWILYTDINVTCLFLLSRTQCCNQS